MTKYCFTVMVLWSKWLPLFLPGVSFQQFVLNFHNLHFLFLIRSISKGNHSRWSWLLNARCWWLCDEELNVEGTRIVVRWRWGWVVSMWNRNIFSWCTIQSRSPNLGCQILISTRVFVNRTGFIAPGPRSGRNYWGACWSCSNAEGSLLHMSALSLDIVINWQTVVCIIWVDKT